MSSVLGTDLIFGPSWNVASLDLNSKRCIFDLNLLKHSPQPYFKYGPFSLGRAKMRHDALN